MNRMRAPAAVIGLAALTVIGLACGSGGTPADAGPGETLVAPPEPGEGQTIGEVAPPPTTMGSMVPRPRNIEQLVARADVIVLGSVGTAVEERQIGGYGDDGRLMPPGEGGIPVTNYEVRIESVLKGDGVVTSGGTLVLRIFGHRNSQGGAITSVVFHLPEPGDHLLFALGKNPDGTCGSGPEGLLNVDGDIVTFADGVSFVTEISPDEFMQDLRDVVANPATQPDIVREQGADQPPEPRVECGATVQLALESPILVARGVDPIPSGFDAVNAAGCTFGADVRTVTLELRRGGDTIFAQEIDLDPVLGTLQFPLQITEVVIIPSDLEVGSYGRLITATRVDGGVEEVLSDSNSVWVLDRTTSSIASSRVALVAARQMLVDSEAIPYAAPVLVSFKPVEWSDASLGCPEPDLMYIQVITPGFRLAFEYEGQRYEHHTNQDGGRVVACES